MNNSQKIIAVVVAIATTILVIVGLIVFNFLTTEQVTIKTSSPGAEIFVDTLDEQQKDAKGKGSASLRLRPGKYNVRVAEGDNETRTAFTLTKGSPVTLDLQLEAAKAAQAVAPYAANNLRATNDTVQFLRPGYNKLVKLVPGSSLLQPIDSAEAEYNSAQWIDDSHAYLSDAADIYWYLEGSDAKTLAYGIDPGTLSAGPDGRVAYIDAGKILVRPSAFAEPEYELDFGAVQPNVVVGPNSKILAYDTAVAAESQDEQASPQVYMGNTKLDKATAALEGVVIGGATWSPDGNTLAISAADGLYALTIDTGAMTLLYNNYITHPETMTWLTNKDLLFFLDQTLWKIKVADVPTWNKLAHIQGSVNPADRFAISPDSKKIYFSTASSRLEGDIQSIAF